MKRELGFKGDYKLITDKSNSGVDKQIFSEFIKEWFVNHYQNKADYAQSTLLTYKSILEKHFLNENSFANKEISEITPFDINFYFNTKLENNYSNSYIMKMHNLLYQAFSQAVEWGKITSNPLIRPPYVKKNISFWSKEEIDKFIENSHCEEHYITLLLEIFTGLKKKELLALKWNDIDFENRIIYIKRMLTSELSEKYLTIRFERIIPVPDFVIVELKKHKRAQDDWKNNIVGLYSDQDLVISTITGGFVNPRRIDYALKQIIKKK